MIGGSAHGRRHRHAVALAASELTAARSETDVASATLGALSELLPRTDHVLLHRIDRSAGTYRVIGGTPSGVWGLEGRLSEHPFLGWLGTLDRPRLVGTDERRLPVDVAERLDAVRAAEAVHLPATDDEGEVVGSILLLRRRRRRLPAEVQWIVRDYSSALVHLRASEERDLARRRAEDIAASSERLHADLAAMASVRSVDEVVGHLLRGLGRLDPALIGAVVGVVDDGVVTRVSAIGTTPRRAVESLRGTRLEGFPIGRRLVGEDRPIFAASEDVTLGTRTAIMEPLGARSLLAAAGRDAGEVRIAASAYRSDGAPPPEHVLGAIVCLLDHAALAVSRIEHAALLEAAVEAVSDGLVVLRRGVVVRLNDAARELVPGLVVGAGIEQASTYEAPEGGELDASAMPWNRSSEEETATTALLRLRSTERIHRVRCTPLPWGGCLLTLRDVTEESEEQREVVSDLTERRARQA